MIALALTLAGYAAAPLADRALRAKPRLEAVVDPMARFTVGLIVFVSVLPEGLEAAGWPALFALLGGIAAGLALHALPDGHRTSELVAAAGWIVHNAADGVALSTARPGGAMVAAVLLHALPSAITGWRVARAEAGEAAAARLLAAAAAATAVGFSVGGHALAGVGEPTLALVQCASAGVLLHLIAHVNGLPGPRVVAV